MSCPCFVFVKMGTVNLVLTKLGTVHVKTKENGGEKIKKKYKKKGGGGEKYMYRPYRVETFLLSPNVTKNIHRPPSPRQPWK